jgi:DNA repair photolyase
MMKVFNSQYCHDDVSVNMAGLWKEAERFSKSKNSGEQVLLSFTGDPYCGLESGETRDVLCAFHEHDIHCSVLTKNPGKAIKDIDIMSDMAYFKMGTTLTLLDPDLSKMWEPGAPIGEERIKALKVFADNGIKTWASFEPVICPDDSLRMLSIVADFIDHVKIGKINNHPQERSIDWAKFLKNAVEICRDNGLRFYIKDDLAKYANGIVFSREERDKDFLNV